MARRQKLIKWASRVTETQIDQMDETLHRDTD